MEPNNHARFKFIEALLVVMPHILTITMQCHTYYNAVVLFCGLAETLLHSLF